jgi:LPXTG-motif cell wall-anchored protein
MDWYVTQTGDLTITTGPTTPTGTYTITVIGSANGVIHQINAALVVINQQPTTTTAQTATVPQTTPQTQTITTVQTVSATTVQTQTVTQPTQTTAATATTATPTPPGTGGFLDIIQQNSLLIIGGLALLIILFAALAFRRRKPTYAPAPPAQPTPPAPAEKPRPSSLYCVHCGTENPPTNEHCGKCGEKLLRMKP